MPRVSRAAVPVRRGFDIASTGAILVKGEILVKGKIKVSRAPLVTGDRVSTAATGRRDTG